MKNVCCVLFAAYCSLLGRSQQFPFKKENMDQVLALRGKVLPFMFGHTRIFTASAGVEYRFLKHHSIGIDGIYEWYKTPTYFWDPVTEEEVRGPFKYFDMRSLHADYRYYFTPCAMETLPVFPYINAFTKIGLRESYFDGLAPGQYHSQREYLRRYGLSIGMLAGFGRLRRFGADFNIGAMYVDGRVSRTDYVDSGTETTNFDHDRWGANVRLNFYWYLF